MCGGRLQLVVASFTGDDDGDDEVAAATGVAKGVDA